MEQTIIRHDVKKEQPEKSGMYLVHYANGISFATVNYSAKYDTWNAYDSDSSLEEAKQYAIDVDYWWELPEVPKETEDE